MISSFTRVTVNLGIEVITKGVESFAKMLEQLATNEGAVDKVQRISMRVEAEQLRKVALNLRGAFGLGSADKEPQS